MSTATQQPDPLQLAQLLESFQEAAASAEQRAAAELRRLHAENQQLRADLEAVGAGGIGPLIPATVQHQHKPSRDNDLQLENGHLITSSSTAPAGWRLVPVEPTPEMLRAAIDAPRPAVYVDSLSAAENLINSTKYRAMLAAAPQPPGGQEPDWQDLYRKEKRRAEMWIAKYEKDIGKLEVAVPVAAQPQVEQEPVAWIENLVGALSYSPHHEAARKLPEGVRFDLYTRPQPSRHPLTLEQIAVAFGWKNGLPPLPREVHAARVVERAHEIGGEV